VALELEKIFGGWQMPSSLAGDKTLVAQQVS
jgi:hypothetical protein